MQKARLMYTPEDYRKIGVKKDAIEPWEDGKREDYRAGAFEWWYFDAILDDGSKITACYSTKLPLATFLPERKPCLTYHITDPDGKTHTQIFMKFKKSEVVIDEERCNVRFGLHSFVGDLQDYHIKAEPVKGFGFDVCLSKQGASWRGETGYIGFGEQDEKYFTWTCAVPRGTVTGTLTVEGKTRKITGFGYHDHQWGNTMQYEWLNNWFWSRQSVGNYNVVLFDFICSEKYGFHRIPLMFIQDKQGNFLFENTEGVKCEILSEKVQNACKIPFPDITRYTFEKSGKKVVYTISVKQELEGRDAYATSPWLVRMIFKRWKTHPKYGRYVAVGEFTYTDGEQKIRESGDLIYEFVYLGNEYKKYIEDKR